MKKIFQIALLLTLLISAGGCRKDKATLADENLAKAVQGFTLPRQLNDGTTLTNCTYADKVLTFSCEVDKKAFDKMDGEKSEINTLEQLNTGLFPRNLIKTVKEAEASIRYVFYNDKDTIEFKFGPDQLQTIY